MIYAVNRLTKEHRVVEERYSGGMRLPCRNPNLGKGWDYIQADADGWIEWRGGECPVVDSALVDIRCRDKSESTEAESADLFRWSHRNHRSDIIAYRPIIDQPASEESRGWDGEGLPPIGSFVDVSEQHDGELMYGNGEENCEVVAHVEGVAVIRMSYGLGCMHARVLVPAKSPREQWVEGPKSC